MAKALGIGPSLYLIQLKYFALLFAGLSLFGFLPFIIAGKGALTFGDLAVKYDSWSLPINTTHPTLDLVCNGTASSGKEQLLFGIQQINYTDYTTGTKKTLQSESELSAIRKYFNASCAN